MVRTLLAGVPSPAPRGDCYVSIDRICSENSKLERCLKNHEMLNQPLDLKVDRLRHREAELLREVRRHNNDRATFDAPSSRNRTNMESHESRTSEDKEIIRELRSEVAQMRASAVPPSLTRDLEAMIGSQKYEC